MADTRGGLCAATHSKLVPGIDVSGRDWVSSNRLEGWAGVPTGTHPQDYRLTRAINVCVVQRTANTGRSDGLSV